MNCNYILGTITSLDAILHTQFTIVATNTSFYKVVQTSSFLVTPPFEIPSLPSQDMTILILAGETTLFCHKKLTLTDHVYVCRCYLFQYSVHFDCSWFVNHFN